MLPDSFLGAVPGGLPRVDAPFSLRGFFELRALSLEATVGFFFALCSCDSDKLYEGQCVSVRNMCRTLQQWYAALTDLDKGLQLAQCVGVQLVKRYFNFITLSSLVR